MHSTERIFIKSKSSEKNEESSNNISFSSNNTFYEKLDSETKRDIIFLIKSGYNKRIIIKLYILLKPSNLDEAVNYLTMENGVYQHEFYESDNNDEFCEICGESREMHISNISKSVSFSFNSINLKNNSNNENKAYEVNQVNIIQFKNKAEIEFKCKICDENISPEEKLKNRCEQCGSYFCSECLYEHIKELIRNGKYSLFCPECSFVYTNDKIDEILSFNMKNKVEINSLKKLLEKSNTKQLILSNPELMFCPIVNCDGFAKKNKNEEYNICTKGHKFCKKCGELWHENGICKEEQNVDKLFEEFSKKYDLKKCPYCHIVTNKNGGCNHITCKYCGKHWCWICLEVFNSTEEHYGNPNSRCFGRMQENFDITICSKCDRQIQHNNFRTFSCDHIICNNCFIENLLNSRTMVIFPVKLLNCIILGCKGYRLIRSTTLIQFIKDTNNEKLIKKYIPSALFVEYGLEPYFQKEYEKYIDLYGDFLDAISHIYNRCHFRDSLDCILSTIGYILVAIFFPVFIIVVPIFFHFAIRDLYYNKFLPEIRKKYYNEFVYCAIILGEEILAVVFLFPLIAWHYIFSALFFPIMLLVLLIRNLIYGVSMC